MNEVTAIAMAGLAVSNASIALSRSSLFHRYREWMWRRGAFWGELASCFYCTSFYLALPATWWLLATDQNASASSLVCSFVVMWLALVGLATLFTGVILYFSPIGLPPEEEKK